MLCSTNLPRPHYDHRNRKCKGWESPRLDFTDEKGHEKYNVQAKILPSMEGFHMPLQKGKARKEGGEL